MTAKGTTSSSETPKPDTSQPLWSLPAIHLNRSFLGMMILAAFVALALPLINAELIYPGYTRIFIKTFETGARRLATHVIPPAMKHTAFSHELLDSPQFLADIYRLEQDLGLLKVKVYDAEGAVLYSSDPEDMRSIPDQRYENRTRLGLPCSKLQSVMGMSERGKMVTLDIINTCVPIMRRDTLLGAFEMTFDVTDLKGQLDRFNSFAIYGTLTACGVILLILLFLLRKENARVSAQHQAEELKADVEQITRHDIKSPLIGALNGIQYLTAYTELTVEQQDMLDDMRKSLNTGMDLINRGLDIYKMEAGTYDFSPSPVSLVSIARRVAADLGTQASMQGTPIGVTLNGLPAGDKEIHASGEDALCYSLLANLVKNAIEASEAGHVVTVDLTENEHAVITVHNATPVPEAIRDTFFDKLATTGKQGGTGLGTYSARLMATTMNGTITMRSNEKEGTTITVTLPLHSDPTQE